MSLQSGGLISGARGGAGVGRLISLSAVYGILIALSLQNFRVSSNMEK